VGLLVPVIRDVDKKNIVELAAEMTQLSKRRATASSLPRDGGRDFHHHQFGRDRRTGFSPIVNHPEVAILGPFASR